jgi:8-oxo-dGTP diphosphatase
VDTPGELWRRARGTTAGAVILDGQGRVLLVKHSYGPLNWEIPGGAAELDETPTERKGPGFEVLHIAFRCRLGNSADVPEPNSPEITQCG